MVEFEKVRGSVVLTNETFLLVTPDSPIWKLHRSAHYKEPYSNRAPLSIAEIIADAPRADLLVFVCEYNLGTLAPRERRVLELWMGFMSGQLEPTSKEDIAREFGITPGRIIQVREKALRRMRHPSRSRYFREFLNRASTRQILHYTLERFSERDREIPEDLLNIQKSLQAS